MNRHKQRAKHLRNAIIIRQRISTIEAARYMQRRGFSLQAAVYWLIGKPARI